MSWLDADVSRALIEASPDAMYVKDLNGVYVAMNAAGARLIGRPIEEIIGSDDRALFDEQSARRIASIDQQVIAEGRTITYEDTAIAAGGARTYSTTKGPILGPAGAVRGMFGISRDLQRGQLAEFAYELRTPLGTIANAVDLLRLTAVGPAVDLLAIVRDETRRAEGAIDRLLDFRPNLPARSPQLLLRLFESGRPTVDPDAAEPKT